MINYIFFKIILDTSNLKVPNSPTSSKFQSLSINSILHGVIDSLFTTSFLHQLKMNIRKMKSLKLNSLRKSIFMRHSNIQIIVNFCLPKNRNFKKIGNKLYNRGPKRFLKIKIKFLVGLTVALENKQRHVYICSKTHHLATTRNLNQLKSKIALSLLENINST